MKYKISVFFPSPSTGYADHCEWSKTLFSDYGMASAACERLRDAFHSAGIDAEVRVIEIEE